MESALFPTLLYNGRETEARRDQAVLGVQPVELRIRQGQTVIRSGEQVTPDTLLQLDALRNLRRPRSLILQLGGYCLLTAILVYSLWRYLVFYQTRHRKIRNHMTLILVILASALLTIRLATALADILGNGSSASTILRSCTSASLSLRCASCNPPGRREPGYHCIHHPRFPLQHVLR